MLTFKYFLKSFPLIFAIILFSGGANAEAFLSRDFLKMEDVQKKFWLDGAITALGHIAAAKSKQQGQCVFDWYFSEKIAERNGLILGSMEKYNHVPPTAVLLAILERECGVFRK